MAYPIVDALAGSFLMIDGQIFDIKADAAQALLNPVTDTMFYEVVRISDNIPLFWHDHIKRLQKSLGNTYTFPPNLLEESRALLQAHFDQNILLENLNLRIVLTDKQRVIHLIPSYYPSQQLFSEGIVTLILPWQRRSPNIKVIKSDYKKAVKAGFARKGPFGKPFELLLADGKGQLSEGSRSNLFFIKDNKIFSAPETDILQGITRKYLLEALQAADIELKVNLFTKDDIKQNKVDAAFISSSPIDLLPISYIEELELKSAQNPIFLKVAAAYQQTLNNWLQEHKDLQIK